MKKSSDESSIKCDKIQKDLNIFKEFDRRSIHDNVYFVRIHHYVVFINYKFEIINFMLEEKTFFEIREKIVRSQTF